ncbi:helix-turn-helix domain-containing protein [Ralstonia pseudosolanacearum]|uniref:helix-turn-helix domain-containing protein n=1 Tax=Ralstonia pseudosolanacearum TaxID=1310165 RepID=UPI003CFA2D66
MGKKEPITVFGRRLRQARRQVGIPQDVLGVEIGLDETTASARISRYESGVHEPPFEIAQKLAKVLRVPTAYLYCDNDALARFLLTWQFLSRDEKKEIGYIVENRLYSKGLLDKKKSDGLAPR